MNWALKSKIACTCPRYNLTVESFDGSLTVGFRGVGDYIKITTLQLLCQWLNPMTITIGVLRYAYITVSSEIRYERKSRMLIRRGFEGF